MTVLKLNDIQHAIGAILATRMHVARGDVFIYVRDQLIYAFYSAKDTEVITLCEERDRLLRALHGV